MKLRLVVLLLVFAEGVHLQGDGLYEEPGNSKGDADTLLVAINVHEKPEVLALQLANINRRVATDLKPQVALSCNEVMFRNLSRSTLPPNVHLNPTVIEKSRFTGSLLRGIVSNLRLLASKHAFKHALILSSRSKITEDITEADIAASLSACSQYVRAKCATTDICHMSNCQGNMPHNRNVWKGFRSTMLAQHVLASGSPTKPQLLGGPHEGLVLEGPTVRKILRFLDSHKSIEEDLYETPMAMEEFALQTLAAFVGGRFGYLGFTRTAGEPYAKVSKVARQVEAFTEDYGRRPRQTAKKALISKLWPLLW